MEPEWRMGYLGHVGAICMLLLLLLLTLMYCAAARNLHHAYLPGKLTGNLDSASQVPCGQATRTTRTIDGTCNYPGKQLLWQRVCAVNARRTVVSCENIVILQVPIAASAERPAALAVTTITRVLSSGSGSGSGKCSTCSISVSSVHMYAFPLSFPAVTHSRVYCLECHFPAFAACTTFHSQHTHMCCPLLQRTP